MVVRLPKACQLTYGSGSDPALLSLIEKVPPELWGARLALQVLSEYPSLLAVKLQVSSQLHLCHAAVKLSWEGRVCRCMRLQHGGAA